MTVGVAKAQPLSYRAMHRIADRLEPDLRRRLLVALRSTREAIDLEQLARWLEIGDPGILERTGFWQAVEAELGANIHRPLRETVLEAGAATQRSLPPHLAATGSFDLTNPEAVRAIEQQGAALVTQVTTDSRRAIQRLIRDSFVQGIPPRTLARRVVAHIGLTDQYSQAVENFRRGQAAAGVAPGKVEARAAAYAERLLRHRATVIARTEIIQAASLGQQAVWRQSVQEGRLPGETKRVWIVTPDDRLCEICAPMENQERGMEEPFVTGEGAQVLLPPAHPQCRCSIGLVFTE